MYHPDKHLHRHRFSLQNWSKCSWVFFQDEHQLATSTRISKQLTITIPEVFEQFFWKLQNRFTFWKTFYFQIKSYCNPHFKCQNVLNRCHFKATRWNSISSPELFIIQNLKARENIGTFSWHLITVDKTGLLRIKKLWWRNG